MIHGEGSGRGVYPAARVHDSIRFNACILTFCHMSGLVRGAGDTGMTETCGVTVECTVMGGQTRNHITPLRSDGCHGERRAGAVGMLHSRAALGLRSICWPEQHLHPS